MIINIKVNTNAKKERVEKVSSDSFKIQCNVPREKGKANLKVIEMLAEYFSVPKASVSIVFGHASSNKIIQIGN